MESQAAQLPSVRGSLRTDIPAAIVVFLVALPLCLGISLASGAPLSSGLIAGAIGGIIIGTLSRSSLSVSGPAAGLATVCADAIQDLGSFEALLMAVIFAGFLQILFGIFRLGVIGQYVPSSVVKGMLAGIGVVIILKQIPHAVGRDADFEGDLAFFQHLDQTNSFAAIVKAFQAPNTIAIFITLLSLLILFSYDKLFKGRRISTFLPGPLIVVVVGTILAAWMGISFPELALQRGMGHFVELPNFLSRSDLQQLPLPALSALWKGNMFEVAVTIAVIASLETLLSLEAVDKLDPYRRISPPNRELIAQGIGNVSSGLLGGLPITAVIVRSSANVYAGAQTRFSAVFHGCLLVLATLFIPQLLTLIPLCALAAILLYVGYKLANFTLFREMFRAGQDQYLPFLATILGIVFTDLLLGVFIGLSIGLFYLLKSNHHNAVTLVEDGDDCLIRFNKDISFINKMELKETLAKISDGKRVYVDGSKAMYIDRDIYDMLKDFEHNCSHRGIELTYQNTEGKMLPIFRKKVLHERT